MNEVTTKKQKNSKIFTISMIAMFVFLAVAIINTRIQINMKNDELEALKEHEEAQIVINNNLRTSVEEYDSVKDGLIEDEAREEYGYARDGEIVFEIVNGN